MSQIAYAVLSSAFAALAILFFAINGGLRAIPAGRRFLENARRQGRVIAPLRLSAPFSVVLVFVVAGVLAGLAALITWSAIRGGLR